MSKQSEAKKAQNYTPKLIPMVCGNCAQFESTIERKAGYFSTYTKESNLRCVVGNFTVKKMGSCDLHAYVEMGSA